MVLLLRSKRCDIELGEEYVARSLEDNLCSISIAKCWKEEEREDLKYYDLMCACRSFDEAKVLAMLKEVVGKVKPEFAIATVVPFYSSPEPELWNYDDVPPKALWIRGDVIGSIQWFGIAHVLVYLLERLCANLEAQKQMKCMEYVSLLMQTPSITLPDLRAEVLEELVSKGLVEVFENGYLIVDPTPFTGDNIEYYYCEPFMAGLEESK